MKHLFTYIFLLFSTAVFAQPGGDGKNQQKIQALYVAYISQELKLTEEEAQKFWPVHTTFTVTSPLAVHPYLSVMFTTYFVVNCGLAVGIGHRVQFKFCVGNQL